MGKTVSLLYFSFSYFNTNNNLEKILVNVESIRYLFCIASELLESDELHISYFQTVPELIILNT